MEDKELDDAIATLEAFIDEAEKTCLALEAENADLRSGEYLARVIEERDRYRKALDNVDALDPEAMAAGCTTDALRGLVTQMGRIARAALEANDEPT